MNGQAVSSYGNVGYVKQTSSRVSPGQVPAVQGQIRQFKSGKRTRYVAPQQADGNQPMPQQVPEQSPIQMPPPPPVAMQQQQYGMQQQQFMQSEPLQPTALAPEEQAIIDRMVDATHPHMFEAPQSMGGQVDDVFRRGS